MYILGVDPGNVQSAFVIIDEDLRPIKFGKIDNEELITMVCNGDFNKCKYIAIEMIASYGMAVGQTVFETCVFIGKLMGYLECNTLDYEDLRYIYRKEEKMCICGSMKAKDGNIRCALIDRFATHDFKNGKGTKKDPDTFYGFKADMWQAMAVAVTYHDMYLKDEREF